MPKLGSVYIVGVNHLRIRNIDINTHFLVVVLSVEMYDPSDACRMKCLILDDDAHREITLRTVVGYDESSMYTMEGLCQISSGMTLRATFYRQDNLIHA